MAGQTADKSASTYSVTGLTPGAAYFFRLRTFTPAHEFKVTPEVSIFEEAYHYQPNDRWSDYSQVAGALRPRIWLPLAGG